MVEKYMSDFLYATATLNKEYSNEDDQETCHYP